MSTLITAIDNWARGWLRKRGYLVKEPGNFDTLLTLTRADLESRGFDSRQVSDTDMDLLAQTVGDNECLMESWWYAVDAAAKYMGIPLLPTKE